jgi:chromosome segregation ATPase
MPHSSITCFTFSLLLLLSSSNLIAQEASVPPPADPANTPVSIILDPMVVKGLTENDFKEFPASEHDELEFEKGERKITVHIYANYDYSSIVRQVILCKIEANYHRKFEKDGPTKAELTSAIVKHITERVNKLMVLKRSPTTFTINKLHEEINRHTAQITELRKQEEALVRKAGDFSPQAAEELKSKFWTQAIDLGSQIEGNQTMVAGLQKEIDRLQKEIDRLKKAQNNYSALLENWTTIENLKRTLNELNISIDNFKKNQELEEKSREADVARVSKQKVTVERQIAELEEKMLDQSKAKNEFEELKKKIVELHAKLSDARAAYRNPRHPSVVNLEQQAINLEKEGEQLKSRLLQAGLTETRAGLTETRSDNFSSLPALQAKLSETRIATDVLNVKRERIIKALEEVSRVSDGKTDLENKRNNIKQHERALDLLNEKLLDARMKIELESQSFELVPLN